MKTYLHILFIIVFNNCLFSQISDFKSVDFTRAENIAKLNKGASVENLPLLAYNLTHTLQTDVEKLRAIYIWVCDNIKGDYKQQNTVLKKRKQLKNDSIALTKWNKEYKRITFKRLLNHKKTICTGYAYLVSELCFLANIESVIINGYGRDVESNINTLESENHSWNAVKLNNKWYLCDATWSSGYIDEYGTFIKAYNDGYFLTPPILFGKSHFPLLQKWTLNNTITASSFTNAPLVYTETYKHNILPIAPQHMNQFISKNDSVTFSFKSLDFETTKKVALVYYIGAKETTLKIDATTNTDNITSLRCKFKHKGTYDVHLKVNGDVVATYTVKVSKP
ncbi:transglutaminase domain-containing protein [Pontimicrobium sp. MEBiC01747]